MTPSALPDLNALRARANALGYAVSHRTQLAELAEQPGRKALFVQIELTPATAEAKARLEGHGDALIGEAPVDPMATVAAGAAPAQLGQAAAAQAFAQALQLHDRVVA